ncbi:hypothetical protein [Bifidobacterium aquikefiri]|uniref:hypothetical protein n=1 Tax=Bifidobacterium aquikefiri TaxID=1653207 RepID=UPI0039EA7391
MKTFRINRPQLYTVAILCAAIVIYTGGELWQTLIWPPFYSFDETLEVDYIYQLTQGHLPTFFGGAQFNPLHLVYPYNVQWRYQHPPLFYLLETPFFLLGDTLNHPIRGIWLMRAFVYMLGVALIITSFWVAKWAFGKSSKAVYVVPILVASNRCLPSVVFNYTLATLWVALLFGCTFKIIRTPLKSLSPSMKIFWIVVVTLAPLTRLSTLPIMLLCCGIVACLLIVRRSGCGVKEWTQLIVAPLALSIASSSWFYIRLHKLSGNFTGSEPGWSATHLARTTNLSFMKALFSLSFYKNSLAQYHNMSSINATRYGWLAVFLLTLMPLVFGLIAFYRITHATIRQKGVDNRKQAENILIFLLCILAFCGTIMQQLLFYKQGGSDNSVYFSLISIAFALTIAAGFCQFRRLWKVLVSAWLLIHLAFFCLEVRLKWPFSMDQPLPNSGAYAHGLVFIGLSFVCIGTALTILLIAKNKTPNNLLTENDGGLKSSKEHNETLHTNSMP